MELNLADIASIATDLNQGRMDWTLSAVSKWANIALTEVSTRVEMTPLQGIAVSSTTSGENRISLPADFDFPINLVLSDNSAGPVGSPIPLMEREIGWIDSTISGVGVPKWYTRYSSWIELAPSPDSSYSLQLRYGAKVRALVDSTDTPNLGERYHYAVALKTAEYLAAARNDVEQEAVNRARYLSYMGSTPSDMAYKQRAEDGVSVALQRNRYRR